MVSVVATAEYRRPASNHRAAALRVRFVSGITFDAKAVELMHRALREQLEAIEIPSSFAAPISAQAPDATRGVDPPPSLRIYIGAYMDLFRLLEEMRFQTALAYLLVLDHGAKINSGEAPPLTDQPIMPAEALALLLRFMREAPSPDELFHDPYATISGNRVLVDWFAAQLLDSVLFRALAACDRLAILLWTRAEIPLRGKAGHERHPAFRGWWLDQLVDVYGDCDRWSELRGFVDRADFKLVKEMRDGFTHSRRRPAHLHGEPVLEFASGSDRVTGLQVDEHLGLAFAAYNEIVRPLVRLTGDVLPTADPT
jgi:hypothetical protein